MVSDKYMPLKMMMRFYNPFKSISEASAWPTSDHGVAGSNPAGGEILSEPNQRFIAQSLSCSPFHRLEMTEILLKGHKTLTHPSIHQKYFSHIDLKGKIMESDNLAHNMVQGIVNLQVFPENIHYGSN